jgi:long-chain acyl-CoA synthetase
MQPIREELPLESLYRWERQRGERIFLTQPIGRGFRQWTWTQAADEVRRMAAYLRVQEWEPGSRIAVLSKNCAWWILADLAVWMAGHVSVPIFPSLRPQSIRYILEHSGAVACFLGATDEKVGPELSSMRGIRWISLPTAHEFARNTWQSIIESTARLVESPARGPNDLATIIYTSGTTGTPKGVMHRFGAFGCNAHALTALLNLGPDERILSYLPLAHIVERVAVEACACRMGWHVYFSQGIDSFLADLDRAQPTLFLSVPRLLVKFRQGVFAHISKRHLDLLLHVPVVNSLVRHSVLRKLGLGAVVHAACGAAPLPVEVLVWYRKLGLDLCEGYGMTETMITHFPRPGCVRPGYVGAAIECVESQVSPEGELLVRSPMNMLGYYRDPAATRAAFTPEGFFRTGDLVTTAPDGQVRIVGRLKEQFKTSKGEYVAPAPIEGRLMAHPAVEACCVMGAGQASPFAVLVISEAERVRCADPAVRGALESSLEACMQAINHDVEPYARIGMLVIADGPWTTSNGFLTPTFKLKRGVLESRYQAMVDEWRSRNTTVVWQSLPGDCVLAPTPEPSLQPDEAS